MKNTLLLIDPIQASSAFPPPMEDACYQQESYIEREGRRGMSRPVPQPPASVISDVRFWTITNFTPSISSIQSIILLKFYGNILSKPPPLKSLPTVTSLRRLNGFPFLGEHLINKSSLPLRIYRNGWSLNNRRRGGRGGGKGYLKMGLSRSL